MVNSLVVVSLVDGHRGMDNLRGDSLLVHDWLNSLVNVMMNVLAFNARSRASGVVSVVSLGGISELSGRFLEFAVGIFSVAVAELAFFHTGHLVSVLLGHHLLVVYRLDGGVVMLLMNLTVNGFLGLLMSGGLDSLLLNRGSNALVHGLRHTLDFAFLETTWGTLQYPPFRAC